jgi:hypothetical protein
MERHAEPTTVPEQGLAQAPSEDWAETGVDPAGHVMVRIDSAAGQIVLEHHDLAGDLTDTLSGRHPRQLMAEALRRGMVSRLQSAAELGADLERAAAALGGRSDSARGTG